MLLPVEVFVFILSSFLTPPPVQRLIAAISFWQRVGACLAQTVGRAAEHTNMKVVIVSKPGADFPNPGLLRHRPAELFLDGKVN